MEKSHLYVQSSNSQRFKSTDGQYKPQPQPQQWQNKPKIQTFYEPLRSWTHDWSTKKEAKTNQPLQHVLNRIFFFFFLLEGWGVVEHNIGSRTKKKNDGEPIFEFSN